MSSRTTFLIVSDHGFKVVSHQIHPGVLLHGDAQVVSEGGTALIYLNGSKSADQIRATLARVEGVERILMPPDFAAFGYPDPTKNHQMADLVVAAKDGYAFAAGDQGEVVTSGRNNTHRRTRIPPHRPGNECAIFIASGTGIRPHRCTGRNTQFGCGPDRRQASGPGDGKRRGQSAGRHPAVTRVAGRTSRCTLAAYAWGLITRAIVLTKELPFRLFPRELLLAFPLWGRGRTSRAGYSE